jgi:type II secretory ATPase GspE/PulE/Tfp pilus assembly ATPase PilB-like protein
MPQETLSLAVVFAVTLLWLSTVALLNRFSKLPYYHKWWANLASLLLGPVGWAYHVAGFLGWIKTPAEEVEHIGAGIDAGIQQPSNSKIRLAFGGRKDVGEVKAYSEIETVKRILTQALAQKATDVHLEPHGNMYVARGRVNGILRELERMPYANGDRMVNAIKVMARMDIADRNRMQDGRFEWTGDKPEDRMDLRVSTSPSLDGEKMAIRFLNRQLDSISMEELGMPADLLESVRKATRYTEGLILIAGPTGSGKTSTAYSMLQKISGPTVNTMTIEDPVEYSLPYATQISVNPKADITFESGLRTLMRQDPNVIFIGEMRDPESFKIGIRASLSGHLVLSTMHARDSVGVMTTLRNLGFDRETLGASLKLVISQRLVRVLCPDCKVPMDDKLDDDMLEFLGGMPATGLFKPSLKGCAKCHGTGFTGRIGIFEHLRADALVQEWLASKEPESALREALHKEGRRMLRDHARERVLAGEIWINDAMKTAGFES